jgi:DNA uptake protein ComE-like DNA-binding protein
LGCEHAQPARRGSVLVIVLWIAFGLVTIALYFANAMSSELCASANRVAGLAADQAIDGAARYVGAVLCAFATNGVVPDLTQYQAKAVPVGDAHFWIIGRDSSGAATTEPYFALIDEGSKLNVNHADTNELAALPTITMDFVQAVLDWRSSTGATLAAVNYAPLNYAPKNAPLETVDELRLVYGATIDLLAGEDVNRNGVLDENETDANHNGVVDPGLFEYLTAFSREPNLHSDGTAFTNVNNRAQLTSLLRTTFGAARASQILARASPTPRPGRPAVVFGNLLQFYLQSGMTSAEFAQIANAVTAGSATYIYGRVNINTANAIVLGCLPGMDTGTARQLINYRRQNPNNLASIAWIVDALGPSSSVVQALAQGDYITTHSYQFTADIAALGPYGRGYRRTKFVFDLSAGTVQVVYRQDLSRLGWALGSKVRTASLAKDTR